MPPTQRPAPSGHGTITETARKTVLITSNPFEQSFRYCRVVRRGPGIWVSGTTAVQFEEINEESGVTSKPWYPEGAEEQTKVAMKRCISALTDLGGKLEDVVRVRMFVANANDCDIVGQVFKTCFGLRSEVGKDLETDEDMVGAAATMIVVPGGFVSGSMLVEVEVDAYSI